MLRLVREEAALSGNGTVVTDGVVVSKRATPLAEQAQREVGALYEERAEEFLHYAMALAHDEELARDAVQESFMRYFVALCGGDKIVAPRAWIYRVMHNYLLDRIKEANCHHEYHVRQRLSYGPNQDIEGECFRHEFLRLIRTALTAREYDCFRLRTQGMRYEEIAATLNLASGTVGSMVHRAMRKLRKIVIPKLGKT